MFIFFIIILALIKHECIILKACVSNVTLRLKFVLGILDQEAVWKWDKHKMQTDSLKEIIL